MVIVRVTKPKSQNSLRAERVREWEAKNSQSFDDVAMHMIGAALTYFGQRPEHFRMDSTEAGRTLTDYKRSIHRNYRLTNIIYRIEYGNFVSQRKKKENELRKTVEQLSEINKLARQLQTLHSRTISYSLKKIELAYLDVVRSSIKRALMEARI